jgi:hypothetical protein
VQRDLPVLAVALTLAAVPLGFLAAMSPSRLRFGVGGLLVVAAGLAVLYVLFSGDSPHRTGDALVRFIEPVLVLTAGVGAVAGVAAAGAQLAERAATPAVLVGLAAPFTLGTMSIVTHVVLSGMTEPGSRGEIPETALLPAVAGLCVAATALLGMSGALGRRPETEVGTPVTATSEITQLRTAVGVSAAARRVPEPNGPDGARPGSDARWSGHAQP